MLNCKETTELVSRSLDEKLTLHQRLSVGLHLFRCVACRRYEQQLKFLRMATRRVASGDNPPKKSRTWL
jgi:predicted anti-sigma-YlaC factor YlaD